MTPSEKRRLSEPLDLTMVQSDGPRLKVWWIPQVPMGAMEVFVSSFAQAKALLETLARYDLFQLANNIKPDFCNMGGVQVLEDDGGWCDYDASDFRYREGVPDEDFDRLTLEQCGEMDRACKAIMAGQQ